MQLLRIVMAIPLIFIFASMPVQSQSQQSLNLCKSTVNSKTNCFTIRGQMYYSASLRIRIYIIGTKRILGVDDYSYAMPKNITDLLKPDNRIYADYLVRPLTEDKPGQMRMVQVCQASNLVVETYDEVNKKWVATRVKDDDDFIER